MSNAIDERLPEVPRGLIRGYAAYCLSDVSSCIAFSFVMILMVIAEFVASFLSSVEPLETFLVMKVAINTEMKML